MYPPTTCSPCWGEGMSSICLTCAVLDSMGSTPNQERGGSSHTGGLALQLPAPAHYTGSTICLSHIQQKMAGMQAAMLSPTLHEHWFVSAY